MNDWLNPRCEPGSTVLVFLGSDPLPAGEGVLLTAYDATEDADNEMPRIQMPDGSVLLGCECWWIPKSEAERQRKETT
jgi:hypothetical protein